MKRLLRLIKNRYYINFLFSLLKQKEVLKQFLFPKTIPVIIINFNQLHYLEQLLSFLINRNFKNIIIIDNASNYPPLLDFYESIKERVKVLKLPENFGHMAFFKNQEMVTKFNKGFFILTDADIVPNENMPKNFIRILINYLTKYSHVANKIGLSLRVDDIPNTNPLKKTILAWEEKYWQTPLEKNIYKASVDTTFALYKPGFAYTTQTDFIKGIRISGDFTAIHGGWYISEDLTDEQKHYIRTANSSSSLAKHFRKNNLL